MSYEVGGRADKAGNRYEIKWTVYQMLKVLEEQLYSITLEALGDDEKGVDVWIKYNDKFQEGQQCKGRDGNKNSWTISSMKAKNIFKNWKFQLDRSKNNKVSLVSPLNCILLDDLIDRAKNSDGNEEHFYDNQVSKSSKELRKFYEDYMKAMKLDISQKEDIIRSIDYLRRTIYWEKQELELKDAILEKIRYLFVNDCNAVFDGFVSLIVDGDILGKEVNAYFLHLFCEKKKFKFKDLSFDTKLIPRINELNEQYRKEAKLINNVLIKREEFKKCNDLINSGKSIIIHGKAGNGKSGCTEEILNFCEENLIPVIAIKLDKRTPSGNAETWGKDLGLPASIAHCIHSISKEKKAVIILDQLDALRWTQAHSRDSLIVCSEIINEVMRLNLERKEKISVIFVCRTYDLENDNNIKVLFESKNNDSEKIDWVKVSVGELEDESVKSVVGNKYDSLTKKLKIVLKTPSSLYIWTKLDNNMDYNECYTANHLIKTWWKQLKMEAVYDGLSEEIVDKFKNTLVNKLDKVSKLSIPIRALGDMNEKAVYYLSTNGFLIYENNKISFFHQSILDYFLSQLMITKFYEDEEITNIIGDKLKQTPARRYQVQMLLEILAEEDSNEFINVGRKITASSGIRFYVKHVFYEVLGQVSNIDEFIKSYIIEECESEDNLKYILNNVIMGRKKFMNILRDNGILDKWMYQDERKYTVFDLYCSIGSLLDADDIKFLKKYLFKSEEDDKKILRCFEYDFSTDSDEKFELRMKIYEKYPNESQIYVDFKKMIKKCEMRTIIFLSFLLENKIKNKHNYRREDDIILEDFDVKFSNSKEIIDILLPFIPKEIEEKIYFSDWNNKDGYKNNLERVCVRIIRKANRFIIEENPDYFLNIYKDYFGKGYLVFNEIILDALQYLPENYSDFVIKYLSEDIDKNIFDKTSPNKDKLYLAKNSIKKHSLYCSDQVFMNFEKRVIEYISPNAIDRYKRRIEYNRSNKCGEIYYLSFWGDLQLELLQCLPKERESKKVKDLLLVLNRKFNGKSRMYRHSGGGSFSVISPINGKNLNNKQWLNIITNKKIESRKSHKWKEINGYIVESSVEEFASTFHTIVANEPERMIKLTIQNSNKVLDSYIQSLYIGVLTSNKIKSIPEEYLKKLLETFKPKDNNSLISGDICDIIGERPEINWGKNLFNLLKDIAINHTNPQIEENVVTSFDNKEMRTFSMLQSNAINCTRGRAAITIGNLIRKNENIYCNFKDSIDKLTLDENPAVQFASLSALWPVYNIDREWALDKILKLYEQDYRFIGHPGSKNMLFRLYELNDTYIQRVLTVIRKGFLSDDDNIIRISGHTMCEMYILKNEFTDEMNNLSELSEKQMNAILEMVIEYFDKDEYNKLSKEIILEFGKSEADLEYSLGKLFYQNKISLERDKDFLLELMSTNIGLKLIHDFTRFLEKNSKSVIEYRDIIISMSTAVINRDLSEIRGYWRIEDNISKLIIGLYDETVSSTDPKLRETASKCLDIWDLMYEKQIGSIRQLSQEILER
ncbi:MAG: hypothetical protein E7214_08725 [Clostridium sp.]|nr:hypothetical protein [Clostridium sp.]